MVLRLRYKYLLFLPQTFISHPKKRWLWQIFLMWTVPPVSRDFACTLFVFSFCCVKHAPSHFLLLYVIISHSFYYFWVRFQQLEYTLPLFGKLQGVFDLAFNIRYLYLLDTLSTYCIGFFGYICIIGLYLFYATKSILLLAGCTTSPPASGVVPWLESVKTSSAGFFPISIIGLLHLNLFKDPTTPKILSWVEATDLTPAGLQMVTAANEVGFSQPVEIGPQWPLPIPLAPFMGRIAKYFSFVYVFDNKGAAPFFGRMTTDLELLRFLGNFSFDQFSLLQFFNFSFQTAFRLWIPLFWGGFQESLAWWSNPYNDLAYVNMIGYARHTFSFLMMLFCILLENSAQQLQAIFYMERWIYPLVQFLNHGREYREYGEITSLSLSPPTKLSHFVLFISGYTLKFAPIYIEGERARLGFVRWFIPWFIQKIIKIILSNPASIVDPFGELAPGTVDDLL